MCGGSEGCLVRGTFSVFHISVSDHVGTFRLGAIGSGSAAACLGHTAGIAAQSKGYHQQRYLRRTRRQAACRCTVLLAVQQ